jgi:hypothetical protein
MEVIEMAKTDKHEHPAEREHVQRMMQRNGLGGAKNGSKSSGSKKEDSSKEDPKCKDD